MSCIAKSAPNGKKLRTSILEGSFSSLLDLFSCCLGMHKVHREGRFAGDMLTLPADSPGAAQSILGDLHTLLPQLWLELL